MIEDPDYYFTPEQADEILELSIGEYTNIRTAYWTDVFTLTHNFTMGNITKKEFAAEFKSLVDNYFRQAAELAWVDGKALLPLYVDAEDYLLSRVQEEYGNINALATRLNMLIREGGVDVSAESHGRADGYAKTLDSVFSNVKLLALPNIMLTFMGLDGTPPEFPCPECKKMKGQRHRAKWWVLHDKVPGSHTGFTCGGWKCRHMLLDDNGQVYTL